MLSGLRLLLSNVENEETLILLQFSITASHRIWQLIRDLTLLLAIVCDVELNRVHSLVNTVDYVGKVNK